MYISNGTDYQPPFLGRAATASDAASDKITSGIKAGDHDRRNTISDHSKGILTFVICVVIIFMVCIFIFCGHGGRHKRVFARARRAFRRPTPSAEQAMEMGTPSLPARRAAELPRESRFPAGQIRSVPQALDRAPSTVATQTTVQQPGRPSMVSRAPTPVRREFDGGSVYSRPPVPPRPCLNPTLDTVEEFEEIPLSPPACQTKVGSSKSPAWPLRN